MGDQVSTYTSVWGKANEVGGKKHRRGEVGVFRQDAANSLRLFIVECLRGRRFLRLHLKRGQRDEIVTHERVGEELLDKGGGDDAPSGGNQLERNQTKNIKIKNVVDKMRHILLLVQLNHIV